MQRGALSIKKNIHRWLAVLKVVLNPHTICQCMKYKYLKNPLDYTLFYRNNLSNGEAMLTSLGADYPAECAQWIICLRHLIAEIRAKQQVKIYTLSA